jgi:alanyl-tRNA synthetase
MTANEVRNSFLKFFEGKGHTIAPSAPVIPYDDPTLLFTNAGMNQFKDVFLGTGKRDYTRVADSQKCIRVSGKHNDLEEVGKDTYHHTFFEMLGNWSFGDYYKKEAITWAWELLTEVWKLPKNRLWATVYKTDDEADECWKKYTDINPSHVLRFGEKDNFWEMGETGPCGPCSEIHIDLSEKGNIGASLINAGSPEAIEIWNLVFIQYNRSEKGLPTGQAGELEPLPAKHVDTGMGFERVVAILQGKKSNYDTDLFQPVIREIETIVRTRHAASQRYGTDERIDISMRVIADHVRALTFAIADGAIPSNESRGYVLRRILRRASRFGRNLELHEPFIYKLVSPLVQTMGGAYPEIKQKQSFVEQVIKGEEEGFNQTLDRGLEIFESVVTRIGHSKVFPGEDAFKLYDTYGFPLDLTELMAEERGLRVDVSAFTELMEEQRERSKVGAKSKWMMGEGPGYISGPGIEGWTKQDFDPKLDEKDFVYDEHILRSRIHMGHELIKTEAGYRLGIILDRTTFYHESGGQVRDEGYLKIEGLFSPSFPSRVAVVDVVMRGNRTVHVTKVDPQSDIPLLQGMEVLTQIDVPRRLDIERNHTATHLVHEALRQVLGTHLHQQGSLVAPDHLRFDFNHFQKISPEETREIEDIVNEKIEGGIDVIALNDPKDWITIDEAKRRYPNVKMFFGDKYGDRVRIVEIDPKFSVELCGGTHVKNTRDIGLFKIISESSVASGIRRIEARTGKGIDDYIAEQLVRRGELDDELARLIEEKETLEKALNVRPETKTEPETKRPSLGQVESAKPTLESIRSMESSLHEHENEVSQLIDETKSLKKALSRKKVREEVSNIDDLLLDAVSLNGFKVVSAKVDASTMDELKSIADSLRAKIGSGVGVLGAVVQDKVALVCVVTDDIIKEKHIEAGKVVGEVAKLVGGGGGGRAHLATAGGKDIQKLDEALKSTQGIVRSFLS